eukprot:2615239-Pleurochrysis_carterae.AAC.1
MLVVALLMRLRLGLGPDGAGHLGGALHALGRRQRRMVRANLRFRAFDLEPDETRRAHTERTRNVDGRERGGRGLRAEGGEWREPRDWWGSRAGQGVRIQDEQALCIVE